MKKTIIIIFVCFLMFDTFTITARAEDSPDYEQLMQYEGFVQAVYKHGVELQTVVAGKYTNNTEWVRENIVEVVANAGNYFNDLKQSGDEFFQQPISEQYKDLFSMVIGVPVTAVNLIGDFFTKLFNDNSSVEIPEENDFYNKVQNEVGEVILLNGIDVIATHPTRYSAQANSYMYWYSQAGSYGTSYYVIKDGRHTSNASILLEAYYTFGDIEENKIKSLPSNSMSAIFLLAEKGGYTLTIVEDNTANPVNIFNQVSPPEISNITNYINENALSNIIPQNYKPVISSYLVCGDEIHNLTITGTTFKTVDGTEIDVAQDETAILNGIDCNVKWTAPTVEYDEDENIVINNPDGTSKPLEQYEKPECEGVLCWLSSLWDIVKGLTSALINIPTAILSGLVETIKFLFVPSAESFNGFIDELNTTMSEKFNLTAFTSVFNEMTPNSNARSVGPATSNVFDGVTVSGLMGTGEVKIIDSTTINAMLPTIHSWIKGFFYVLLAFFNINHLYKLIRGTTIFESMRGKND